MCTSTPKIERPAPAPAAPPQLEQVAPKSASDNSVKRKRSGLSRYKLPGGTQSSTSKSPLGGITKKTGV